MTLLSQFNYYLPKELIAQKPIRPRDHSRLMVLDRKTKKISHHYFFEIINFFHPGDVLVFNDSKVIPARLLAQKETGGKVEILLLKKDKFDIWEALISSKISIPGLKLQIKNRNFKKTRLVAWPIKRLEQGQWLVKFNLKGEELKKAINKYGLTPLPPYIKIKENDLKLRKWYQTVYAKHPGSIAAPTAGFHFTKRLINQLKKKGVKIEFLTLHVNLATFQPVKTEKIEDHKLYPEMAILKNDVAKRINQAKKAGQRIIAVGTTTVRTLESFFDQKLKILVSGRKMIDLFIYPGYKFKVVDALITNFHLPKSTTLMLVSAFAGRDFIFKAYKEAIKHHYRFYSFGDAMLII